MTNSSTDLLHGFDQREQITPNKLIETNNNMSDRRRSRLTLPAEYVSEKPVFNRPKASTLQTKNLQQVRAVYGSNSLVNAVMAESGLSGNTTTNNQQLLRNNSSTLAISNHSGSAIKATKAMTHRPSGARKNRLPIVSAGAPKKFQKSASKKRIIVY